MTPERWRELEELYDAVWSLTPAERSARLKNADPELRSSLEAILAQDGSALNQPAWEGRDSLLQTRSIATAGAQFGPYKIERQIGAGGMGEVFRAIDTRLGRAVALKTCREEFSERFQREARTIAALNHPHICCIYDVGPNYLVMELLDGESLAAKLTRGKFPIEQTLLWCRQIADALSAAHSKGIVHRDIKPANVMINSSGLVKVLDFGLAKQISEPASGSSAATALTEVGTALGTPAYMAPEQAQGKEVDKRADVWAFGVLLYELLTGGRPFLGDSMQATLVAVLTREPDLSMVPARVRPLLRACLKKDPQERLSSVGDWRFLLDDNAAAPPPQPVRGRWIPWAIAAAALVALGVFGLLRFAAPSARPALIRFGVPLPGGIARDAMPALSPDGRSVAIAAIEGGKFRLRVRPLDSLEARLLPGADGARFPFWSPDGQQIGFFADGKLKTMPAAGGEPVAITAVEPNILGATWGARGVIVFSQSRELYKVNEKGGVPERLYQPDSGIFYDPEFLPDGNHVLWVKNGVFLGSLDGKPPVRLLPDRSRTVYSPDGYLLFVRQGRLTAQRFDLKTLVLTGEAFPIMRGSVVNNRNLLHQALSAACRGALAYVEKAPEQLVWVDRTGSIKEKVGPPQDWYNFRLSADEGKVVFNPDADVTVFDLRRGTRERLTSEQNSFVPMFSPDGKRVAFSSNRTGRFNPFITDGPNREKLVVDMQLAGGYPTDWSPDSKSLLYHGNEDLWIVPVDGKEKPYPFAKTRFEKKAGSFSPDGKWVAYSSNESLRDEVYLTPFPAGDGKRYPVSNLGGASPAWRSDGKEIYFVAGDGRLTAVPVAIRGSDVQFGRPESLFPVDSSGDFNRSYEPSRDGQRFLIAMPPAPGAAVTVVLNWTQALGK